MAYSFSAKNFVKRQFCSSTYRRRRGHVFLEHSVVNSRISSSHISEWKKISKLKISVPT